MEPRSNVRLTRTKPRFVRGVVIGDTDLTATELTNIETVANLDAEDLEAPCQQRRCVDGYRHITRVQQTSPPGPGSVVFATVTHPRVWSRM